MFNNLNEFIIERILFFGNTTNRVKQSKVNEWHKYYNNSNIRKILKLIKLTKSVNLKAKNLNVKVKSAQHCKVLTVKQQITGTIAGKQK